MIRATSPTMGHPGGAPTWKPYQWRGKPVASVPPVPPPPSDRKREPSKSQDAYRERLAALAQMRLTSSPHPEPGKTTLEQAARELNVSTRTILRYKQELRQMAGAS